MLNNREFAEWARKFRFERNITQKEMAAKLGYSNASYLNQVEKGTAVVSENLLDRIILNYSLTNIEKKELCR